MDIEEIKAFEEQKIFQKNYSVEMLLAVIGLKQVEPLYRNMKDNDNFFSFVSDKFAFDAEKAGKIIKNQKERYARVIFDLKSFASQPLSSRAQSYIFSLCKMLLKPALKFGYAEEGLSLLKMMHDENLVGQNALGQEFKDVAAYTFDMEIAILGLRYQRDNQPRTKIEARSLMNQVCAGKFGPFPDLTAEHFKEIFNSPHETLKANAPAETFSKE